MGWLQIQNQKALLVVRCLDSDQITKGDAEGDFITAPVSGTNPMLEDSFPQLAKMEQDLMAGREARHT